MMSPEVSVVVPTHNRADRFQTTLDALAAQTYPTDGFEVIVVADGCKDNTVELVRNYQAPYRLRWTELPGNGAAQARNRGAELAEGRLLIFMDDDIEALPGFVAAHVTAHAEGGRLVVGYLPTILTGQIGLFRANLRSWWERRFTAMAEPGHRFAYSDVLTGNLSLETALFRSLSGFDGTLRCEEDFEFGIRALKAGAQFHYAPDARGFHHEHTDLDSCLRRKRQEGKAEVHLGRLHPEIRPALLASRLSLYDQPQTLTRDKIFAFFSKMVRYLAFHYPKIGDGLAFLGRRLLDIFETMRLRYPWRLGLDGLMAYWYWRGMAEELGSVRNLKAFLTEIVDIPSSTSIDIDLKQGVEAACRQLDTLRPATAQLRYGSDWVGILPSRPGHEGLRGVHLRSALTQEFADSFLTGLATDWGPLNNQTADISGFVQSILAFSQSPAQSPDVPRPVAPEGDKMPQVSVIIPAQNAAGTIIRTLDSLRSQIVSVWEAIVVDDGSSDETVEIVSAFAQRDSRIRLLQNDHPSGVSRARNRGVEHARASWVLFLDADDTIVPGALALLLTARDTHANADILYGGWNRVAPNGEIISESFCQDEEIFLAAARYCPFVIHACLVRKSVFDAVNGFDPVQQIGEDWDLWQRIARQGACFQPIPAVVAGYWIRPDSSSTANLSAWLEAGFRVIATGHRADPRVSCPLPAYEEGAPVSGLAAARTAFAFWLSGLAIALERDPLPLLDDLSSTDMENLVSDPNKMAELLVDAAASTPSLLQGGETAANGFLQRCQPFLSVLEDRFVSRQLPVRVSRCIARQLIEHLFQSINPNRDTVLVGSTLGMAIETTCPLQEITIPSAVDRFVGVIVSEGDPLGILYLAVAPGSVPRWLLQDAIAAEWAWQILGRFFAYNLFPMLDIVRTEEGWAVQRGEVTLARHIPVDPAKPDQKPGYASLHDTISWGLFLQELWQLPQWPENRFYSGGSGAETSSQSRSEAIYSLTTERFSDTTATGESLNGVCVGGVRLDILLPLMQQESTEDRFMAEVNLVAGFELCRIAVREALIGKPLTDSASLAKRLNDAAEAKRISGKEMVEPSDIIRLGRYPGAIGTGVSRRVVLPAMAAETVRSQSKVSGQLLMESPGASSVRQIWYDPSVFRADDVHQTIASPSVPDQTEETTLPSRGHDVHYFETLFAQGDNPWSYTSPYETRKYAQTLELITSGNCREVLELACAEGHFTERLMAYVDKLIAADISAVALERAAERCQRQPLNNVSFVRVDLIKDSLPDGLFDVIVCSEVLYFVGGRVELETVGRKFIASLKPGGRLVLAHANVVVDNPSEPGFGWDDVAFGAKTIGETFASLEGLRCTDDLRTPFYRIQQFEYVTPNGNASFSPGPSAVPMIRTVDWLEPDPDVLKQFLWQPENSESVSEERTLATIVTSRLPILMYHRVAPGVEGNLRRFCLSPDDFEEQLKYLSRAGFRTIALEEWQRAMRTLTPLPGRAIVLTFDDGYADFAEYAWPLLRKYGFTADVFLVSDLIGHYNEWDSIYGGQPVPLMHWPEIQRLYQEGCRFGSHTRRHPWLTSLTTAELVEEALESRVALERGLGGPVNTIAYPYGDVDPAVSHYMGGCGYVFGLTCRTDSCSLRNPSLMLPRIEITGQDRMKDFLRKISVSQNETR
jgi:glycosyltransferase involved in cell wall biosynthesis/peptidoglycan/xylan/chitin deacetylase (PgdA/CDA1 family)/ubiquinone/menaquinone biosynthesis C-methylase UbiE